MLTEIRAKSQITIPKEMISKFALSEGDKLEVFEKDGMICFIPVSVYPKNYVDELKAEILSVKANIKAGKQPVFDNIDAMFEKLEEK